MKTIGLVGGMSWHSTATYYRLINEEVAARLGGHASAKISLQSLDFAPVRTASSARTWPARPRCSPRPPGAARRAAPMSWACAPTSCTRTSRPSSRRSVPRVHIADAVAAVAPPQGLDDAGPARRPVGDGGDLLRRPPGQSRDHVVVPGEQDREMVDRVVFDEITQGRVPRVARGVRRRDARLAARGAHAVVLACTEIGLLVTADGQPAPPDLLRRRARPGSGRARPRSRAGLRLASVGAQDLRARPQVLRFRRLRCEERWRRATKPPQRTSRTPCPQVPAERSVGVGAAALSECMTTAAVSSPSHPVSAVVESVRAELSVVVGAVGGGRRQGRTCDQPRRLQADVGAGRGGPEASRHPVGGDPGSVGQSLGATGETTGACDVVNQPLLFGFVPARADVLGGQVLELEVHGNQPSVIVRDVRGRAGVWPDRERRDGARGGTGDVRCTAHGG